MRIIAKKTLRDFWTRHPECEQQLKAWHQEAEEANWKGPNNIKQDFPSASIIGENRVVFNIKGNDFRLVAIIIFASSKVYIRYIGTHSEYDKIDCLKIYQKKIRINN